MNHDEKQEKTFTHFVPRHRGGPYVYIIKKKEKNKMTCVCVFVNNTHTCHAVR